MKLRVASFNILNISHAVKWSQAEGIEIVNGIKRSNWESGRKERVFECLKAANYDIVCLQEMCRKTWREFKAAGFALTQFAVSVNRKGLDEPDYCDGPCIVYNPTTVELKTDIIGVTSIDKRYYSSATFKELSTNHIIQVFSIHLKGYNPQEIDVQKRRLSKKTGYMELCEILLSLQTSFSSNADLIIIAGDMNEDQNEANLYPDGLSRCTLLAEHGFSCHSTINFNNKIEHKEEKDKQDKEKIVCTEFRTGRKIDWIFGKRSANSYIKNVLIDSEATLLPEARDPKASDHALVLTSFQSY